MDAFLGMIAAFGFNFAPRGWMACSGQLLSIQQNSALFSLLGTMYGGNGIQTFALPNLQGRVAIGQGQSPGTSNYSIGQAGGTERTSILTSNLPPHIHSAQSIISTPQGAIVAGDATTPENNYLALSPKIGSGPNATTLKTYATPTVATPTLPNGTTNTANIKSMAGSNTVSGNTHPAGVGQPIDIIQPYLAMNYCIATQGIFPSRN